MDTNKMTKKERIEAAREFLYNLDESDEFTMIGVLQDDFDLTRGEAKEIVFGGFGRIAYA
jgi:hypothetical protein